MGSYGGRWNITLQNEDGSEPHTLNDKFSSSLNIYQTSPAVTDEDEIRGVEKGVLYPYVKTSDAYHCPADKYRKDLTVHTYMSAIVYRLHCMGKTNPSYNRQIKKLPNHLTCMRYNFVESGEKERGNLWIAGGHFIMATPVWDGGYGWWSPIAINHGDSSVFGFVTGMPVVANGAIKTPLNTMPQP